MNNSIILEKLSINKCDFYTSAELINPDKGTFKINYTLFNHEDTDDYKLIVIDFHLFSTSHDENQKPLFQYKISLHAYIWHSGKWENNKVDQLMVQVLPHIKSHFNILTAYTDLNAKIINFETIIDDFKEAKKDSFL